MLKASESENTAQQHLYGGKRSAKVEESVPEILRLSPSGRNATFDEIARHNF